MSGRANRGRRGQLLGSQIPYAATTTRAVGTLMIPVVRPPFGALAVPSFRRRHDDLARRLAAGARAVLLAAVALAADREEPRAERAAEESVIALGHALAGRRFLASLLVPREGAHVDAPSRDTEGWEVEAPGLRPFRRATGDLVVDRRGGHEVFGDRTDLTDRSGRLQLIERHRVHHAGLVVVALILSALQRSTDTQGRWLDARRTYEAIGGAKSGKTSFRNNVLKLVPVMNRMLRHRLKKLAEHTSDTELRGRLSHFADVLVPDGCAFKVAAALSGVYAGTGTAAELKLHAVYGVRAGGAVSVESTAGSMHDSDGFWPERWEKGALYLWDLGFENKERFIDAAQAGAHVLQRLKSTSNPLVLTSYGPTGHGRAVVDDQGRSLRLEEACAAGVLHHQHVLDLDVRIEDARGRAVVARVVCVPFGGEDRYYLTTLPRAIFTPHDVAELYRVRWEVERMFRGWRGALRLDEVQRLSHPQSLLAAVTASLLAATFAQDITRELLALDRADAISP